MVIQYNHKEELRSQEGFECEFHSIPEMWDIEKQFLRNNEVLQIGDMLFDIDCIEYTLYGGHYAYFHMQSGNIRKVRIKQEDLESVLIQKKQFEVISKGIIINFDYVRKIGNDFVVMEDDHCLLISRRKRTAVHKDYNERVTVK